MASLLLRLRRSSSRKGAHFHGSFSGPNVQHLRNGAARPGFFHAASVRIHKGVNRKVTKWVCAALAAMILGFPGLSGCTSAGSKEPSPSSPAGRLQPKAPTAAEMETALNGNGHARLDASLAQAEGVPPAMPGQPPVDESIHIETKRLHGYTFPGAGAPLPEEAAAGGASTAPAPALAQDGARFTALEQRLQELESRQNEQQQQQQEIRKQQELPDALTARVQELETKIAALENRPAQTISGTPEQLKGELSNLTERLSALQEQQERLNEAPDALITRLQAMETKLAALENRPPQQIQATADTAAEQYQVLAQRLATVESQQAAIAAAPTLKDEVQKMEQRLAAVENRPPQEVPAAPDQALEARFNELSAKLAALESQPAVREESSSTLQKQLEGMEARLAQLENRPPREVQTEGAASAEKFNTLSQRLAQLEAQQGKPAQEAVTLQGQLQAMETRLAALENRPARVIQARPENMEERFNELSRQLAALETQQQALTQQGVPTLRDRVGEMESRVAALENRPPQPVQETSNLEQRFNELSQKLAALEARPPQVDTSLPEEFQQRLQQTEQRVAVLEQRPAPAGQAHAESDQRLASLQDQLNALKQEVSTSQAALENIHVASAAPSAPAVPAFDGAVFQASTGDYRLGAGDRLEFVCFNDPLLSREEVFVLFDGTLMLPLIDNVNVLNLTRAEAEEKVQTAYRSVFKNPRVSLMVREVLSKSFTVVGDIQDPGMYPYQQPIRLIDAISLAGGLRDRSSGSSTTGGLIGITGQLVKAFVIRRVDGERQVLDYDLRNLGKPGAHASEAPVYPGDLIYIPEGVNLVYMLSDVDSRVVELTQGMTLLQMLSLAGSFQESTQRLNSVVLMRETDGVYSDVMKINVRQMLHNPRLDIVLNPGDIIYVPRRRLVRLEEFVGRFTGSISPVLGMYNEYIDARYSKRISEQLLQEDNSLLDTIGAIGSTSQQLINIIGGTNGGR